MFETNQTSSVKFKFKNYGRELYTVLCEECMEISFKPELWQSISKIEKTQVDIDN